MNSKLVSVIMPAYNAEGFIVEAIDSVLAQTYPHWELIVIDDGSVDRTSHIVQAIQDERIRYAYQENRGQAAALNYGLDLACGDYITTLDVDDWFTPNSLGDRVAFLDRHPRYGAVYGDGLYCDPNGKEFLRFNEHMPSGLSGDVYDLLVVSPFYGTGAGVMQRRDVLTRYQIRYDDGIVWCQDWDFYIRVAEVVPFGFVESLTIRYRIHSGSMTEAMPSGRRLESLIRLRDKVLDSPRFRSTTHTQKYAFFYDYLVKDLNGDIAKQEWVMDSAAFNTLEREDQARLQRYIANRYLLEQKQTKAAKRWLRSSWKKAPFEPRTTILVLASMVSPEIARRMIQSRQSLSKDEEQLSPFEMVLPVKE